MRNGVKTATLGNIEISGTKDSAITSKDVVITLANDTVKTQIAADTDLAAWITNLPAGLTAKAKAQVNALATSVTITIAGTPTEVKAAALAITVPSASLTGGADVTATANANAKFAIVE